MNRKTFIPKIITNTFIILMCLLMLNILQLLFPSSEISAQSINAAYGGDFGMNLINYGNSAEGFRDLDSGTMVSPSLALNRINKAKEIGVTWERVNLAWNNIERYNSYASTLPGDPPSLASAYAQQSEIDAKSNADTGNPNNDLFISPVSYPGVPDGGLYQRRWEAGEDWCTSNEAQFAPKSPAETTWTYGSNDNIVPGTGVSLEQLQTQSSGLRQYTDLVELNYSNGIQMLGVLQTAPRCRSIVESSNVPFGLENSIFINDSNSIPPGGITEANLNPANPWAFYVFRTVNRYKEEIDNWQIWNEMNEGEFWNIPGKDPVQRAQLYGRLSEIAKVIIDSVDPGSNIVMGGLVYDTQGGIDRWYTNGCGFNDILFCDTPTVNFVRALVTEESAIYNIPIKDLFDTYALHRYCVPWATINYLHWVQTAMQFGTDKSWWLTELGGCGPSGHENAEFAMQLMPYLLANQSNYNIEKFFLFQMDSLVSKDLSTQTPMFTAFQTIYEYLRDASYDSIRYMPDPRSTVDGKNLSDSVFFRTTEPFQAIHFSSPRYERVSVVWNLQEFQQDAQIDRAQNGRRVSIARYDNTNVAFGIVNDFGNVKYSFPVEAGSGEEGNLAQPLFMIENTGCSQSRPTGTLCAQFYGETNFQGPVIWEEEVIMNGQSISFNWGNGSPIPNEILNNDTFSVKFTGNIDLPIGAYDAVVGSDDGIRVNLDGQQFDFAANTWTNHSYRQYNSVTPINVTSGGPYPIIIDYYENTGNAQFDVTLNLNASACVPDPEGGVAVMALGDGEFQTFDAGFCPRLPNLNEFQVNYYNDVISGAINFDSRIPTYTTFLDTDPNAINKIDYNWGTARPVPDPSQPNLIDLNNFAVRFWGTFDFPVGGDYIFRTTSDNGIRARMKIDIGAGQILTVPIIDDWQSHTTRSASAVVSLPPGQHKVIIEYYDWGGVAVVSAGWEPAANTVCQTPTDGTFCVKYYNNTTMTGAPVYNTIETLTRTDHPNVGLEHTWSTSSPGNGVNVNNFSAVWEGYMNFDTTDTYRFITNSDNGMRLFVDNALVVDDWTSHNPARVASAYRNLTAGLHLIRVEYYETTGNATAQFYWENMTYLIDNDYECSVQTNAFCTKFYNTSNFEANTRIVPNHATIFQPSTFTEPGRTGYTRTWGTASPVPGIVNVNKWTAVFEGKFTFAEAGEYEFTSESDDGMKIYVDGILVVDNWGNHPLTTVTDSKFISPGLHTVTVVYYEFSGPATSNFWWEKVSNNSPNTTYPYGIIRADTDPVNILGNQSYTRIKNIPALFDGVYVWPNNAVVHYVNHTPISVIMEFENPVTLNGFKVAAASERWDVYMADTWEDMEAGNYTVVGNNFTPPHINGYANINFSTPKTAKVFKIKFTRTSGDGIVHILDIVPQFGTSGTSTGPSIAFIPNQTIRATQRWVYRPYVNDPNDGPSFLYFNLGANPEGIYYASTANTQNLGYLEWLPWINDIGTHQIFVTVRDTEGNTATRSFFLTVIP